MPGSVLLLALEDNPRRLQRRMSEILGDAPWPERLKIATEWPRIDAGGLEEIEAWIASAPDPRLVIVDVLAKVRPAAGSRETQYETDYRSMSGLQAIAGRTGVGIVALHHTRKMTADDPLDAVSGTTGLAGSADTVMVIARDKGHADAVLYVRGRDVEETESALSFDPETCSRKLLGNADEYRKSEERRAIDECLRDSGTALSPTEIADLLGKDKATVRQMLTRMTAAQEVNRVTRGKYEALPHVVV